LTPGGILSGPIDGPERTAAQYPHREATPGLRVLHRASGFTGELVALDGDEVVLRGHTGLEKRYRNLPGTFAVDGTATHLVPARASVDDGAPRVAEGKRTASGSRAVVGATARVARGSRIWVEGVHDAELVEKVWGDDLRAEGVVVEYLGGVDDLERRLAEFRPGPERRVGVLVDHLVADSKESRIAAAVQSGPVGRHVLVVGHPFVDIWQAVRPERLGVAAWPTVPPGTSWKHGVCQRLGWPARDQADIARAWRHILSQVSSYADLEPALLGRVEELIDYVTGGA
jgi:Protein of unknown function (DUF3097)